MSGSGIKRRRRSKAEAERLEWALGVLLEATRTTSRNIDLLTAASALSVAREKLGSLSEVSKRIGVSVQMLRDFAAVEKLCVPVRKMYADKRLTSVDVAVRLSRLIPSEQKRLAREYAAGELTSREVRDVVSIRRRMPKLTIQDAIRRVKGSRDLKRYIIILPTIYKRARLTQVRERFARIIGKGNIVSLRADDNKNVLIISEEGERNLRAKAVKRGISKRRLVQITIKGGLR